MELLPALFLLCLWLVGVPVRFLAGCMAGALVIEGLVGERIRRGRGLSNSYSSLCLILIWTVIVFCVGLLRFWGADEGIDFAIFTQVMHSFAQEGRFATSLVSTHWVDFLTHHFAPALALPGLVARFAGESQVVALALHAIAIGVALWAVHKLGELRNLPASLSVIIVALVILHPSFRNPVLWEVHDEIFAAPFLLFGIYSLEARRLRSAVACFLVASLCKETMLIVVALSIVGALLADWKADLTVSQFNRRQRVSLSLLAVLCVVSFVFYTKILPFRLFNPTFDLTSRIGSVQSLLSLELWQKKVWWFVALLAIPALLIASFQKGRTLLCSAPRAAGAAAAALLFFVGVVVITDFEPNLNPYTYYQVLPVLLTGVLLMSFCPQRLPRRPALVAAVLCLCFCFGAAAGPVTSLVAAKRIHEDFSSINSAIPEKAVVVASDWDAAWLVGGRQVMRAYHANRNLVRFDYIVSRRTRPEPLSRYLRSWSRPCFSNSSFVVRCALPSVANDPAAKSRLITALRANAVAKRFNA